MKRSWVSVAAAFATMFVVTLIGVVLWFRPIAEQDEPGAPLLSPALSLTAYSLVSVVLFSWAARRMSSSSAAAFVIASAQIVLVIDLSMRGDRGWSTAGAGAVLIAATWAAVAAVHAFVARRTRS